MHFNLKLFEIESSLNSKNILSIVLLLDDLCKVFLNAMNIEIDLIT